MASPVQQIIETQQLGSSAGLLYTSPSNVWTQIIALTAVNTDTATRTITLYIVPSGGSAGAPTESTPPRALLAGGGYNGQNEYGMVLNPGDAIWGVADTAAKVNVFASGLLNVS
jgi:hypothetical protein